MHMVSPFQNGRSTTLSETIEKNNYIRKIDLKDAWVVVLVHKDSRSFIFGFFLHQRVIYKCRSLAFGLNIASQEKEVQNL